jgi:hypothetical protein
MTYKEKVLGDIAYCEAIIWLKQSFIKNLRRNRKYEERKALIEEQILWRVIEVDELKAKLRNHEEAMRLLWFHVSNENV